MTSYESLSPHLHRTIQLPHPLNIHHISNPTLPPLPYTSHKPSHNFPPLFHIPRHPALLHLFLWLTVHQHIECAAESEDAESVCVVQLGTERFWICGEKRAISSGVI